jgi:hypothetical protein
VERRTVGPLVALVTLLVVAAGLLGAVSFATLGFSGGVGGGGGRSAPRRTLSLPVAPPAGTLIKTADGHEVSVVTGSARIPYRSWTDLTAGYGSAPAILTVSDAVYAALPTRVTAGTLIKAAGNPAIAVVRDGRRQVFRTWEALVEAYGPKPPFVVVPAYYFDGLPIAGS